MRDYTLNEETRQLLCSQIRKIYIENKKHNVTYDTSLLDNQLMTYSSYDLNCHEVGEQVTEKLNQIPIFATFYVSGQIDLQQLNKTLAKYKSQVLVADKDII